MIAFLDAEYNSGEGKNREISFDLIEIALIICDNFESGREVESYSSIVKPTRTKNLFPYIVKLTGIKQNDVDKARSFNEVMNEVLDLVVKYRVKAIYTFGEMDEIYFKKNFKINAPLKRSALFLRKMKDITPRFKEKLKLKEQISLKNMAVICKCDRPYHHRALDDTIILKDVAIALYGDDYSKKAVEDYKKYVRRKSAFHVLKNAIRKIEKNSDDLDLFLSMIKNGESFPEFFIDKN